MNIETKYDVGDEVWVLRDWMFLTPPEFNIIGPVVIGSIRIYIDAEGPCEEYDFANPACLAKGKDDLHPTLAEAEAARDKMMLEQANTGE